MRRPRRSPPPPPSRPSGRAPRASSCRSCRPAPPRPPRRSPISASSTRGYVWRSSITAVRSTGLRVDAAPGRSVADLRLEAVGQLRHAEPVGRQHARPRSRRCRRRRTGSPTRRPRGRRGIRRPCAVSISSSGVATSSAPASRSAASTTRRRRHQRAGVRLRGAFGRLPGRRQHDHRLAGRPRRGDRAQEAAAVAEVLAVDADRAHARRRRARCATRSPAVRSAWLPIETKCDRPSAISMPYDMKSTPSPPDCDTIASGPGTWPWSSHAASNASCPLHTPMQFGPSRTAPAARTRRGHALLQCEALRAGLGEADRDADERPHAARPGRPRRPPRTPAPAPPAPRSRRARRSSRSDGTVACPCTSGARALTRCTRRRPAPRRTPRAIPNPHLAGSSDAPTTATERGCEQRLQLALRHVIGTASGR